MKYWGEIKYHMSNREIQVLIEYKPGLYQGLFITGVTEKPTNQNK